MRRLYLKSLVAALLLFLAVQVVLAATCGDGDAAGREECDGADLRGYECWTVYLLEEGHISDYKPSNAPSYGNKYLPFDGGELSCYDNCTMDVSGCFRVFCGDGEVHGSEECDDGYDNSDAQPDACRTDCRLPHCGDWVIDSGEQCDDGPQNSNQVPDACRTDCTLPTCGDGVIDVRLGEECDDDLGECFRCRRCRQPYDGMVIDKDTVLCDGYYQIDDEDGDGVIHVSGDGVTLFCGKTVLYGVSHDTQFLAPQGVPAAASQAAIQQGDNKPVWLGDTSSQGAAVQTEQQSSGFLAGLFGFISGIFGGSDDGGAEETDTAPDDGDHGSGQGLHEAAVSQFRRGIGFLVTGKDSAVIGCEARNYRKGFDVRSNAALVRDVACDNNQDILLSGGAGAGIANTCDGANWHDAGFAGCQFFCDGSGGPAADGQEVPCPESSVPDCPPCPEASCAPCEPCSSSGPEAANTTEDDSLREQPKNGPEDLQGDDLEEERTVICPDGSVAASSDECPKKAVICPDGVTSVLDPDDCPSCPKGEFMCKTGSCVAEKWMCDPYVCPDGTKVESADDCCPYKCEDGSCASSEEDCPDYCSGYTCSDGSCVKAKEDCSDYCKGYVCDDGSCVSSEKECPEYCPYRCEDKSCADDAESCIICCKTLSRSLSSVKYVYGLVKKKDCVGFIVDAKYCSTAS